MAMTHKNIHWIMTRYDHTNPHGEMTTSHIARLIGCDINYTRKELQRMFEGRIVKKIKGRGKTLKWSAV